MIKMLKWLVLWPFYLIKYMVLIPLQLIEELFLKKDTRNSRNMQTQRTGSVISRVSQNNNATWVNDSSLNHVDHMTGEMFERWCANLLWSIGFQNVQLTRASGDQGVDIIAYYGGLRYAFQCKRFKSHLGNKPIQEVNTGRTIYGCDRAVVMTNSYFTKGAVVAANAVGVELWDRQVLSSLAMRRYNIQSGH